jgi:hypothetical protein
MKVVSAFFLIALGAFGAIQDLDFKNFTYLFIKNEFDSVPDKLRWMPRSGTSLISPHDGQYTFPCDDSPCPLLTVDQIDYGNIKGLPETIAIITTTYHTGGTATWDYLYVIALRSGKPEIMAWLEAGSRAYMGLRRLLVDHGDLVLIVEDPDKRQGDCCSSGTITYRYRWHDGSFHQIGKPVLKDDPQ